MSQDLNAPIDKRKMGLGLVILIFIQMLFIYTEYLHYLDIHLGTGFSETQMAPGPIYRWLTNNHPYYYFGNRLILSIILLGAAILNQKASFDHNPKDYHVYGIPFVLFALPVFYPGFIEGNFLWNVVLFPILLIVVFIFAALFAKAWLKQKPTDDEPLLLASHLPANDMSFEFDVVLKGIKGDKNIPTKLRIHSPQQGILIRGGAGAGKSASLLEPIHFQAVQKGYSGFIYDFKGSESPLSIGIYNSILTQKDKIIAAGYKVPSFHYINVLRPLSCTGKLNPLNPKHLSDQLYANQAGVSFYRNLDRKVIKDANFFQNNAMKIISSCIWALRNEEIRTGNKVSTPAHLITLLLQPIMDIVGFLLDDEDVAPIILDIKEAKENEAGEQLAGVASTFSTAVGPLFSKRILYFFGPEYDEEEIPLNINNKYDPVMLCVCNNEQLKKAMSPMIGTLASIMINILADSKPDENGEFYKTLYSFDEFPTIYVDSFDTVPAEMRSKNVSTVASFQTDAQNIRDLSRDVNDVIKANLGNQFSGATKDEKIAEELAKSAGEWKPTSESITNNETGQSTSVSKQKERVLQSKDISGQPIGHFYGSIAGGDPSQYYAQFPDGRTHKLIGCEKGDLKDIPANYLIEDNFENPENISRTKTQLVQAIKDFATDKSNHEQVMVAKEHTLFKGETLNFLIDPTGNEYPVSPLITNEIYGSPNALAENIQRIIQKDVDTLTKDYVQHRRYAFHMKTIDFKMDQNKKRIENDIELILKRYKQIPGSIF